MLIFAPIITVQAQVPTQVIRGKVVDEISKVPIPGATVMVSSVQPASGAVTDMEGEFRLPGIPVGNHTLRVMLLGYEELIRPGIVVNSGKEVVLQLEVREKLIETREVTITAELEKNKPMNEMSLVSTRTFSVEETRKFAAAVNDPARMVTSFAGVLGTDDGNNNISIRGNAPAGLQWRMEGVEIPSPNHFSFPGTSGGGISILSAQLLYNSDFLTGAFTAEYGNALSGVFDLKLRKGNNEKQEITVQAGFLGLDLAVEGPFSKKYKGSYLINYRYSTLAAIGKMIELGDAATNFQDLSLNLFLPAGSAGQFTVFGFGGLSSQDFEAEKDSLEWEDEGERYSSEFRSNTGVLGTTHALSIGKNTFLKSALVASLYDNKYAVYRLDDGYRSEEREKGISLNDRQLFSTTLHHKFNARHSLRTGLIVSRMGFAIKQREYDYEVDALEKTLDVNDDAYTTQAFVTWMNRITERLSLQLGAHYLGITHNRTWSVEPRASVKYTLDEKQNLSLGYGLHSQVQALGVYFGEVADSTGSVYRPNENLELSKSHHVVLGYDRMLKPWLHVKLETYYQHLFDIPVSTDPGETFSILNLRDGYYTDALVNKGLGKNYGLELTFEQFMRHDLYFLFSSSLYESRYRASDGKWRNTQFNGNYSFSFTGGREFKTGPKMRNRIFGVNVKVIYAGGLRKTPIDLDKSLAEGTTYYFEDRAFSERNPDYFRTDIRVSMKRNRPRATHLLSLDIQNVTNRKNIFGEYFNPLSGKVKTYYQTPLIPVLSYRVEF
ncbi:MAG: TonB-dependent receptor [Bacteroidia bacterium]|nr:TonB-dependent receptor [Bacteroidia bacterium]